jgi:ferrous iron transport protein B
MKNLVLQVLEITDRAVLCLNLIDECRRHNIEIDYRALARELGIPVVPAAARQKEGMDELLKRIHEVATGKFVCKPRRVKNISKKVSKAVNELTEKILAEFPSLPNARWVAMRLLEGDQSIIDAVKNGELGEIYASNKSTSNVA